MRLKRRRDFLRVAQGARAARPGLVLQARAAPETAETTEPSTIARVGFTATRKIGTAVVRNRARRRLRAAVATVLAPAARPGHDYVVVARAGTLTRDFAALLDDLRGALAEVHRKAARRRPA